MTPFAAPAPVDSLRDLLKPIRTMRANFTQVIFDDRGKAIQRGAGRMAVMRPAKFRWEITKPIPQLIIANGSRLWIYDPDLEQVTIRPLQQAEGETPALLLSHDPVIEKNFTVKATQTNVVQKFTLIPKEQDSMFASIQLNFMKGQIKEMRLQDHLGHMTLIQFQRTEINKALSPALFVFKIPANVDVIDETRQRR